MILSNALVFAVPSKTTCKENRSVKTSAFSVETVLQCVQCAPGVAGLCSMIPAHGWIADMVMYEASTVHSCDQFCLSVMMTHLKHRPSSIMELPLSLPKPVLFVHKSTNDPLMYSCKLRRFRCAIYSICL